MIRKEPTKLYLLWKKVPEERQILTTGFNPVKKKQDDYYLFCREKVPEERQILTTGFNPVIREEPIKLYFFLDESSVGTTDIIRGF